MLTADLVRAYVRKGVVRPRYLDPDDEAVLARVSALVAAFEAGKGRPRSEVEEDLDWLVGHDTDFLIWRGLAKLLYDRCEFETISGIPPLDLRRAVFEAAAGRPPADEDARRALLEEVAEQLSIDPNELDESLYADLAHRQRLLDFSEISAEALLHRYNLALAQAVLYRATRLTVQLPRSDSNDLRFLFQQIKFNRLIHRVFLAEDGGYVLEIDGPTALFNRTRKYGLNIAKFLPALVLLDDWKLSADLDWKGTTRVFELDPTTGLRSHYKRRGNWVSDEEKAFERRFAKTKTTWQLARCGTVVGLGSGEVLVADYELSDPSGRRVAVEIVGFWRLAYLERRIAQLHRAEHPLVLVVSERLRAGREALEEAPQQVVFFKGAILADKVIAAAEAAVAERS